MRFYGFILFASAVFYCLPVTSQETSPSKPTYRVEALNSSVKVDGVLEEDVWNRRPTFTLDYETRPGDNIPARVRTEMWITYDRSHLYVGARAHDPNPELIRARLTDRDLAFQDDFIGVVLDTFNDERRAFEFFVNPLGVQMDLLQNEVTGNEDDSWDAIWDSAGRVTANGYEVEMAIPFSSLRFPNTSGSQTWGIDAVRIYPRDQRYRIGLNKLPRGGNCYLCYESKLTGFVGIKPGRNLEFDPTLTANQTETRDHPDQSFDRDREADPGLTARWGVTPGITINAAVNPDFSQVEADAAELTVNTQFAIFFPEKRPLFLEGADLFETRINAIYSRDIADPSWGVKVSGKEGKHAFGAIVARDERTNFIFPGSQFSSLGSLDRDNDSTILRYRYDLGSGSTVGGIFTNRQGSDYHNSVVGGDMLLRWGEEAVRIEFLGSRTSYPLEIQSNFNQPSGDLSGTAVRAVYQHIERGWMGYVLYQGADTDFRADLGFIPQVDYHKGQAAYERYWYSEEGQRWWRRLTIGAESNWLYDRSRNPLQQQIVPYFWMEASREFFAQVNFGIGPSYFNGRRFDRNYINGFWEMRPTGSFYLNFEGRVGQEIDFDNTRQGEILRLIPGFRFDVGRSLRLELNHNFETLDVEDGELYRANVSEVRATYQFNTRVFVRVITQYFDVARNSEFYTFPISDRDKTLFNQLLFSYTVNPQTVLFLGYSDNYQNGPFHNLAQANRTLFFKVGYAFVL